MFSSPPPARQKAVESYHVMTELQTRCRIATSFPCWSQNIPIDLHLKQQVRSQIGPRAFRMVRPIRENADSLSNRFARNIALQSIQDICRDVHCSEARKPPALDHLCYRSSLSGSDSMLYASPMQLKNSWVRVLTIAENEP